MDHHLSIESLRRKTIDCHSHVGMDLKSYGCGEYPYGQTIEELVCKQKAADVDVNIVFPAGGSLFFEPSGFVQGEMRPAENPLSPAPYARENELLLLEIFEFNPEHRDRFLPFVMVDPARKVSTQLEVLRGLEERFPIYGVKVAGVNCQSKTNALLDEGRALLDYASERDLPLLLHTTVDPQEEYSHAQMCFEVIDENPQLRFCLAHCIGFHAGYLNRAARMPNVWVDTAALKIQVQCVRETNGIMAPETEGFEADYSDHKEVMGALMERYPETILWGTDSPWYTFICRRKQGEGSFREFRLKGSYEEEKAALDSLPDDLRLRACNANVREFLFRDLTGLLGGSIKIPGG